MKVFKRNLVPMLVAAAALAVASAAFAGGDTSDGTPMLKSGSGHAKKGVAGATSTSEVNRVANKFGDCGAAKVLGSVGGNSGTATNSSALGKTVNIGATTTFGRGGSESSNGSSVTGDLLNQYTGGLQVYGQRNDSGSGITITHGGNPPRAPEPKKPCHDGKCYSDDWCRCNWQGHDCEVFYGEYIVVPGDSLPAISLKLYGTNADVPFIAAFNQLPVNAALVPGQVLLVPSIETIVTF
jgi:nucleoid-associated protein YgaU